MENTSSHRKLASYFLEELHKYYPIGLAHFTSDHSGFQLMKKILENKVKVENPKLGSWRKMNDDLRPIYGNQIVNRMATMFPSMELSIILDSYSKIGLQVNSSLFLSVSLLVNYYAIVVIDSYVYEGPSNPPTPFKFVCSGDNHHLNLDENINTIKNLMELHFPDYVRAPHNVLFNYKISGGVPFSGSYADLGEYTFYDYLFSDYLFKNQYIVAH